MTAMLEWVPTPRVVRPDGHVYYDAASGRIVAVAFAPDESLGQHSISVPFETAADLIENGAERFKVGISMGAAPAALIPASQANVVTFDTKAWTRVPETPRDASQPVTVLIRIARRSRTLTLVLEAEGRWRAEGGESFSVTITRQGDPSLVLAAVWCPFSRLFDEGRASFLLPPQAVEGSLAIYAPGGPAFRAEIVEVTDDCIPPPPGRLPTLVRVPVVAEIPDQPCLIVRRVGSTLQFHGHLGGGNRYDLNRRHIPLILSPRGASADAILLARLIPPDPRNLVSTIPSTVGDDFDIHIMPVFETIYHLRDDA